MAEQQKLGTLIEKVIKELDAMNGWLPHAGIESDIKKLKKALEELNTQLTKDVQELKDSDTDILEQIDSLNTKIDSIEGAYVGELKARLEKLGEEIASLQTKDASIETQVEVLQTGLSEESNTRRSKDTELESNISKLSDKVDAIKVPDVTQLEQSIESINVALETEATAREAKDTELENKVTTLTGNTGAIETDIASVKESIETLKTSDSETSKKVTALENSNVSLTEITQNHTTAISSLENTDDAIKENIASLKAKDNAIDEDIALLKTADSNLTTTDEKLQEQITALDTKVASIKPTDTSALETKVSELDTALTAETTARTEQGTELDGKISTNTTSITNLQEKVDAIKVPDTSQLETDVANLKTKDAELENKVTALETSDTAINASVESLQTKDTELEKKITDTNVSVTELEGSVSAVKETAEGAMQKSVYDADGDGVVDNASKVNGHTVESDVPSDAVFTDTVYDDAELKASVETNASSITALDDAMRGLYTTVSANKSTIDTWSTYGNSKIRAFIDDWSSAQSANGYTNLLHTLDTTYAPTSGKVVTEIIENEDGTIDLKATYTNLTTNLLSYIMLDFGDYWDTQNVWKLDQIEYGAKTTEINLTSGNFGLEDGMFYDDNSMWGSPSFMIYVQSTHGTSSVTDRGKWTSIGGNVCTDGHYQQTGRFNSKNEELSKLRIGIWIKPRSSNATDAISGTITVKGLYVIDRAEQIARRGVDESNTPITLSRITEATESLYGSTPTNALYITDKGRLQAYDLIGSKIDVAGSVYAGAVDAGFSGTADEFGAKLYELIKE